MKRMIQIVVAVWIALLLMRPLMAWFAGLLGVTP